ncbi:MAG: hypothetical protein ACK5Q1_04110 [Limnobacter sp.]|jgi:hypothetical protein
MLEQNGAPEVDSATKLARAVPIIFENIFGICTHMVRKKNDKIYLKLPTNGLLIMY